MRETARARERGRSERERERERDLSVASDLHELVLSLRGKLGRLVTLRHTLCQPQSESWHTYKFVVSYI